VSKLSVSNHKQQKIYVKNLKRKNHEREREFTMMSEHHNEFYRVILGLQSLGFDVVIRNQPPS